MKFHTALGVFALAFIGTITATTSADSTHDVNVNQVARGSSSTGSAQVEVVSPTFTDPGTCSADETAVVPDHITNEICKQMCKCVDTTLVCDSYGFCDGSDVVGTCTAHQCGCVGLPLNLGDENGMTEGKSITCHTALCNN